MKRKLFFTSDWHIGDVPVLTYDKRPFNTIEEMHEALIKNFNYYVPPHGITYFLGDMGQRKNGLLKSIIDRLHGTKILIRGNHDGKQDAMYTAGFDVVIDNAQITLGKNIITMSHCPLPGIFKEDTTGMGGSDGTENWHGENKHKHKYTVEDFGQLHLHGHLHSRKDRGKIKDDRQMDVGVMGWNYKPVSLADVQRWIESRGR